MTDELGSTAHTRTLKRRPGQRPSAAERKAAQETFLRTFANTANLRASAMAAKVDRNTIYKWLETDEQFSFQYHQAELDASDCIRAEIWRRAIQGVEEPIVSMGSLVYEYHPILDDEGKPKLDEKGRPITQRGQRLTVRKYSDALLSLLARARMPEFRDKSESNITLNTPQAGSITLNTREMTNEELAMLRALGESMQKREKS
jgi:hypothetical protein